MKKIFFIFMLTLAGALCASIPFRVFFEEMPVQVHPLVSGDEIYLPLGEMARLFKLRADVNLQEGKILLIPLEEKTNSSVSSNPAVVEAVILGTASRESNPGTEILLTNVTIKIFAKNPAYNEVEDKAAIDAWIRKGDLFYFNTHGLVSETTTDLSGSFAFSSIPPGKYELFAVHPESPLLARYWQIPFELMKGETTHLILNDQNGETISLAGDESLEKRKP